MYIFLILFAFSFIGLFSLFFAKLLGLKNFSEEETLTHYKELKPFWSDFYTFFVVPTVRIHQEKVRPAVYKEIEKLARRFRIITLRLECLLMRFTEYIRGKRMAQNASNGQKSHYWEQLNKCKNGAHEQDKE